MQLQMIDLESKIDAATAWRCLSKVKACSLVVVVGSFLLYLTFFFIQKIIIHTSISFHSGIVPYYFYFRASYNRLYGMCIYHCCKYLLTSASLKLRVMVVSFAIIRNLRVFFNKWIDVKCLLQRTVSEKRFWTISFFNVAWNN